MKRLFAAMLVLVLMMFLGGCGKEPTLDALMAYPMVADSLDSCADFLKDCGYDITNTTEKYVAFTDGEWEGVADTWSVTLTYNAGFDKEKQASFEDKVTQVRSEIQNLCGNCIGEKSNKLLSSTDEYYRYDHKQVVFTVTDYLTKNIRILIMPAPAN